MNNDAAGVIHFDLGRHTSRDRSLDGLDQVGLPECLRAAGHGGLRCIFHLISEKLAKIFCIMFPLSNHADCNQTLSILTRLLGDSDALTAESLIDVIADIQSRSFDPFFS